MSLLFLSACYAPPLEGGSVVYLYNIISHMPPGDVVLFTNARRNQVGFDATQAYKIFRNRRLWDDFGKRAQVGLLAEWFFSVARILSMRADIELLHAGEVYPSGLVAWGLSRLFHKPYVVYLYAEELTQQNRRTDLLWGKLKNLFYKTALRRAAAVVVVSDYTGELVLAYGVPPSRIHKVLPTLAISKRGACGTEPEVRRRLGLQHDHRIILSVGRLIERKGHDLLIRAWPAIMSAVPETRLIIVGKGPYLSNLQALVQETGVENEVTFAGAVDEEDLQSLYNLCEIFVMPHRELENGDTEGCPTVFLEAGAHGKPVIGGLAGGVRDAILDGETGLLVDGKNPDAIATAVIRLLRDPLLAKRLGEAGKRRSEAELLPAFAAERVMALSKTIIERADRVT
ncbi:MAG TPA: hypothetical protein DDZ40_00205 [Deltaproteobacteria bacterium]|nr:hypothetical protein [Deltaproteobacteria bacterium]